MTKLIKKTQMTVGIDGAELRRRRIEAELSQLAVAARCEAMGVMTVSQMEVSRIERGLVTEISLADAEVIERALAANWPDNCR
jgi:transcriptional regulator with XRE-family HTH domain